jgi:hypothetical protein
MSLEAGRAEWPHWVGREEPFGRADQEDANGFYAFFLAVAMAWGAVLGGAIGYLIGRSAG